MPRAWVSVTSGVLVALCAQGTFAADQPVVAEVNQHNFLSVSTPSSNGQRITYETCNQSPSGSGFHWKAAGFGVGAPDQLKPMFCARREVLGFESATVVGSPVAFQDGASGQVNTWVPCSKIPLIPASTCDTDKLTAGAYNFIWRLGLFARAPDQNNVEPETLTVKVSRNANGDGYALVVEGSRGFEHVRVALPQASNAEGEIQRLVGSGIAVQTFSAYRNGLTMTEFDLANDIPSQSPVLVLKPTDGNATSISLSDLSKLGKRLIVLVEKQSRIAVRSDVDLPDPR